MEQIIELLQDQTIQLMVLQSEIEKLKVNKDLPIRFKGTWLGLLESGYKFLLTNINILINEVKTAQGG